MFLGKMCKFVEPANQPEKLFLLQPNYNRAERKYFAINTSKVSGVPPDYCWFIRHCMEMVLPAQDGVCGIGKCTENSHNRQKGREQHKT